MKIRSLALASLFAVQFVRAATFTENFSRDPLQNGWQVFGSTNLFRWEAASNHLAVTWDSAQTNSYFYRPLGMTLTKADSFCLQFDLRLTDVDATGYFELAIGLCNFADATSTNFSRANATSPNLFEFDYYPDGPNSWGPSIDATLIDTNSSFYFAYDATQPLANGVTYRVMLIHRAGTSTINGMVLANGQLFTLLPSSYSNGPGDFSLDTLAVFNYTTTDDAYPDLLLAHGTVDNFSFTSPLPVENIQAADAGQIQFASDDAWRYTLEQSADFKTWTPAAPAQPGNGTNLVLQATNAAACHAFYRVRAELP